MTAAVSVTQANVFASLGSFLASVVPAGTPIVVAQTNRVAPPAASTYLELTVIRDERIETNVTSYADCKFTAAIAGTTMTVTAVVIGAIATGATLSAPGVAAGTTVLEQTSGPPGGAGTYTVSTAQTVAQRTISSGARNVQQNLKVTVQIDFHAADDSTGADLARAISTLMRDAYAADQFAAQSPNYGVAPLYADDPRQAAFVNDQAQWETRWIVECLLQVNPVVSVPQQFADSVALTTVDVGAAYGP